MLCRETWTWAGKPLRFRTLWSSGFSGSLGCWRHLWWYEVRSPQLYLHCCSTTLFLEGRGEGKGGRKKKKGKKKKKEQDKTTCFCEKSGSSLFPMIAACERAAGFLWQDLHKENLEIKICAKTTSYSRGCASRTPQRYKKQYIQSTFKLLHPNKKKVQPLNFCRESHPMLHSTWKCEQKAL